MMMMNSEMMMRERRLYEASLEGDISSLMELLKEDPLILEKVINGFTETPLHIAAMFGHVNFADELLRRKPDLTSELDSQDFSPLHLAASRKNIDMVKVLLKANPNVCCTIDKEGRTPLHLAAMKGRIEAMKELISSRPGAIQVVADRGETILHLCVKHNRLEALKLLLEVLNNNVVHDCSSSSYISINSKDDDGNTTLHLAVAEKHWEMIKFLLNKNNVSSNKGILEVNALNKNDFTPLDVLIIQSARDLKDIEIRELLGDAGCVRASSLANNVSVVPVLLSQDQQRALPQTPTMDIDKHDNKYYTKWVKDMRTSLIVVASLIATMAFQAGLTPPGGLWPDDAQPSRSPDGLYITKPGHTIGTSIMAGKILYSRQVFFNTIGFVASLSIILLLLSGLPLIDRRSFVWMLVVIMWIAITSMAFSFGLILELTRENGSRAAGYVITVWMVLMGILVISHIYRGLRRWWSKNRPCVGERSPVV